MGRQPLHRRQRASGGVAATRAQRGHRSHRTPASRTEGIPGHEVEGRAFLYRPVEAPRSLAARAVRHILDRFCNGSVDELVSGLVEADVLSDAELATLEASIKARAGARIKRLKKGR